MIAPYCGRKPDDFEVVLVTYRSRKHIEELLRSWPDDIPVAVVDNSGDVDDVAELVARYPSCRFMDGGGQGFARAANLGAFTSSHRFIVFVNPDTRPSVEDLSSLVSGLADDPDAASHAATVTSPDGAVEIGVGGWEPTVPRALVHALGLHKKWRSSGIFACPRSGEDCQPDWTTGACMAVPVDVFRRIGGFDELFYVYAEDMSYGRRARMTGYRQVLRPDILVRHGAGNSGAPALDMLRLRGASFSYYMSAYHASHTAVGVLGATVLGYALRTAVAFPSDRTLARQYVAFIRGMVTRTATAGGVEVSRARYLEESGRRGPRWVRPRNP